MSRGTCTLQPVDAPGFSSMRVCELHHDFQQHPLMDLNRLARLARDLMPSGQCRFVRPGTAETSSFVHASNPSDGRSIEEVFADIERPGSWIALYDVQTDVEYAELIDEVLGCVQPLIAAEQGRRWRSAGFIFISAPPSATPFHIDRENNFWLQIRGRKTMTVFDHRDRKVVSAKAVEDFIVSGSLRDVRLDPLLRARGRNFEVGPGQGVYFPSTSPHMTSTPSGWAVPGDGVSISIGVVFYTDLTRHHARVHQCNRILRKLGVDPGEPGSRPLSDALKAPLGRGIAWSRARWRDYSAPPGAY